MGELDDYIETVEARRKEIARLILTLRDFLRDRPRNSFSAMLIANPGSGKSYLVSKLAATLGIPHRSFNVTQLITRASINACFDEIANAQAHNRDRVHMVFFDEINASVGNGNVYDLFLTVLEDGTYRRDGQLFKLDPCVWLFAGTTELDGTSEEAFKRKEADFKSRLTVDAVRVGERGEDTDERRALILQGALQLQLQHTDVKTISAEVLKAFFCLDPENTNSRRIRQLAGRFRDIQYGEVRAKNLPDDLKDALRKHGAAWDIEFRWLFQKGETDLDQILVEIKRQPDKGDYEDFLIPKGST